MPWKWIAAKTVWIINDNVNKELNNNKILVEI